MNAQLNDDEAQKKAIIAENRALRAENKTLRAKLDESEAEKQTLREHLSTREGAYAVVMKEWVSSDLKWEKLMKEIKDLEGPVSKVNEVYKESITLHIAHQRFLEQIRRPPTTNETELTIDTSVFAIP